MWERLLTALVGLLLFSCFLVTSVAILLAAAILGLLGAPERLLMGRSICWDAVRRMGS